MVTPFQKALAFLLKAEGGYINDPKDHGGPTNHGITQKTYDAWRHAQGLPDQPVLKITMAEVQEIYQSEYWAPFTRDKLTPQLWFIVFNAAVNMGVGTAQGLYLKAHGSVTNFIALQRERYLQIVAKDPSQKKFLAGWFNRLNDEENEIKKDTP